MDKMYNIKFTLKKIKNKNKVHRTYKIYGTDSDKRGYVLTTEILPSICKAAERGRFKSHWEEYSYSYVPLTYLEAFKLSFTLISLLTLARHGSEFHNLKLQ